MSIYLTGASGFVGKNLIAYFDNKVLVKRHERDSKFLIKENAVIHLAGKAHDLNNITNADEYYEVNTELTKQIFDAFLISDASVFIMLSSVKAVADNVVGVLTEDCQPNPKTHYGKSKLLAESYILSKTIPNNKRVYILRPCMIHGPSNKGNLNLLYNLVSKRIPWILGSFENKRSYCSIDNLLYIINQLLRDNAAPSGVYNVSDNEYLSTNEVISLMSYSNSQKPVILKIPIFIVIFMAKIGDLIPLPLNSERLKKLTESYMVSNAKIKKYILKDLPISSKQGILKTLKSFQN